jgi:hypothetical protein
LLLEKYGLLFGKAGLLFKFSSLLFGKAGLLFNFSSLLFGKAGLLFNFSSLLFRKAGLLMGFRVCFFSKRVCFWIFQVCFLEKRVCFWIFRVCFWEKRVCLEIFQVCFFSKQVVFFAQSCVPAFSKMKRGGVPNVRLAAQKAACGIKKIAAGKKDFRHRHGTLPGVVPVCVTSHSVTECFARFACTAGDPRQRAENRVGKTTNAPRFIPCR